MSDLKKEFKNFLDDIEKNIKNPEDLQYVKGRVSDLFGVLLEEMEKMLNDKEEKMNILMKSQQQLEMKLDIMQQTMDHIEKDIYLDDGFDFEIVCPYCNYEFLIDIDENKTEIECPECNNIIELDWSGDLEGPNCSHDGCSGCAGGNCQEKDPGKSENEDDM